jgi:hypothetical protein
MDISLLSIEAQLFSFSQQILTGKNKCRPEGNHPWLPGEALPRR